MFKNGDTVDAAALNNIEEQATYAKKLASEATAIANDATNIAEEALELAQAGGASVPDVTNELIKADGGELKGTGIKNTPSNVFYVDDVQRGFWAWVRNYDILSVVDVGGITYINVIRAYGESYEIGQEFHDNDNTRHFAHLDFYGGKLNIRSYTETESGERTNTKASINDEFIATENIVNNKIGEVDYELVLLNNKYIALQNRVNGMIFAIVFDTEAEMREALEDAEFTASLPIGANLYIRQRNVSDFWWDGIKALELETEKVDLSNIYTKSEVDNLLYTKLDKVTSAGIERVYSINTVGDQILLDVSLSNSANSIVKRSASGSISVGTPTTSTHATNKTYVDNIANTKQPLLTAGENITIENNVISATGGGTSETAIRVKNSNPLSDTPEISLWQGTQAQHDANPPPVGTWASILDAPSEGGGQQIYDIVIRTQTEFEELYNSSNWLGAKSVAFIGNGGTLEFTRSDGQGIRVPSNVKDIMGLNHAIIKINNTSGTTISNGLYGSVIIDEIYLAGYSISNLTVKTTNVRYAFRGFSNISNCCAVVNGTTFTGAAAGFMDCSHLSGCVANCGSGASVRSYAFYYSRHLIDCLGVAYGNEGYVFGECSYLNGCRENSSLEVGVSTSGIWGGTNTFRDDQSCQLVQEEIIKP